MWCVVKPGTQQYLYTQDRQDTTQRNTVIRHSSVQITCSEAGLVLVSLDFILIINLVSISSPWLSIPWPCTGLPVVESLVKWVWVSRLSGRLQIRPRRSCYCVTQSQSVRDRRQPRPHTERRERDGEEIFGPDGSQHSHHSRSTDWLVALVSPPHFSSGENS